MISFGCRMGASRVEAVSHVVRKRAWDDAVEEEKGLKDEDPVSGGTSARQVHIGIISFLIPFMHESFERINE